MLSNLIGVYLSATMTKITSFLLKPSSFFEDIKALNQRLQSPASRLQMKYYPGIVSPTFSLWLLKAFPCFGSAFKAQNKGKIHRKFRWSTVGTKLNKTAYAEGTYGPLVSSLASHLLSKMAAYASFEKNK